MSDVLTSRTSPIDNRVVSPFEFWPGWLFYTPIVFYWLGLGVRYRSFTLATAANPLIESGGLCGESKSAILDQVAPDMRCWIADYVKVRIGTDDLASALSALGDRKIGFPLVAKPDIGCHGDGVRLVNDVEALARVFDEFPAGVFLLLQEFVPFDGEAGVFYVKVPGEAARITSLTLKEAPFVEGDGRSTLRELILAGTRTGEIAELYFPRLRDRLDGIVPAGRTVRLVFTGNHCKGSIFRNGAAEITANLTRRIDEICSSLPAFHFGRVDLRYADLASLRRGDGFRIIEINGVGSEATHIWDPQTTLFEAYKANFKHYGYAFRIGNAMRQAGHRPTSPLRLLRLWRRQTRLMASYPIND